MPRYYTADADHWCPACAERHYPGSTHPQTGCKVLDREGNPVGAVFGWETRHGDACRGCGEVFRVASAEDARTCPCDYCTSGRFHVALFQVYHRRPFA